MAVKHIWLYGTEKEIVQVLCSLPYRTSDRRLEYREIFSHMNNHLGLYGVEKIFSCCLSKVELTPKILDCLKYWSKQNPKFLYRVTSKNGDLLGNGLEDFTNYNEHDSEYPGPFGALCKRYGKPYWSMTDKVIEIG